MVDGVTKPVEIEPNAGLNDSLQAAARYIGVIIGAVIAILGLLRTKDIAGLIAFVQANGGAVLAAVSGLASLAVAAYGVFKTHKRGAQLNTVEADNRVPPEVLKLKT
jgi:hypothetical protein